MLLFFVHAHEFLASHTCGRVPDTMASFTTRIAASMFAIANPGAHSKKRCLPFRPHYEMLYSSVDALMANQAKFAGGH